MPVALAAESRRQVTVLFSDVAGSTQLGERLDAEAVRSVMRRYFALATEAIERYGGTVEKFIGDAVMAVFGLPDLHEDDALRAVRAALDLRAAVAGLGAELEAQDGIGLAVRIGVNSGEVMAGDATVRQQLVTGDPVNVAARLEQMARPGEILLGPLTWQLVRDGVEAEEIGPVEVKGRSEVVVAHRLAGLAVMEELAGRRFAAPMVGRDRELGAMQAAFGAAIAERACRLVTIIGPAGIGKSRLTHEFVSTARRRATVLRGRCLPYGEGITYWPIAMAVRTSAGIADTDDPATALAKLEAYVAALPESARIANGLAGAIGLGSGAAPREEIGWAVRRLLEGNATDRPVVLVVDDIQWGEETLLDLLESIVVLGHGAPVVVLGVARPELLDVRPGWGSGVPDALTLRLEALPGDAAAEMVANLAEHASFPPEALELLTTTAEGNPLFLEELMAMLVEDGVLERTLDGWRMAERPVTVQVPPTIQALLAARLDHLDPGDRAVAQRAAVIGRVFQRGAVIELSQERERAMVDGRLVSLVRKELIRPDTTGDADDAFRFRHLLVRDAAYEGLPKQERAELHRRFAEWLLVAVGERLPEFEEIVGHHFERAYWYRHELRLDGALSLSIAEAGARHMTSAAFRALDRSDLPAATGLLRRSLALMRFDDPHRIELEAELIDALMLQGHIDEATTELGEMGRAPGVRDDSRARAWYDVTRLLVAYQTSNYSITSARPVFEAAIREFETAGDLNGLGRAWLSRAHATWWQLKAATTVKALDRALACAQQAGRHSQELSILSWLVRAHAWGSTPIDAALGEMGRIEVAAVGDRRIEASVAMARAHLHADRGDIDIANRYFEAAVRTFTELDMIVSAGEAAQAAYYLGLASGRREEARSRLQAADARLEAIGETAYLSTNLAMLANLELDAGRVDEAEALANRSDALAATDDLASQWTIRIVQAGVEAARGHPERALQLSDDAVSLAADSDFHVTVGEMLGRAAEIHLLAGDEVRARELLEQAHERFSLKGATAFVADVERRLTALGPATSDPG